MTYNNNVAQGSGNEGHESWQQPPESQTPPPHGAPFQPIGNPYPPTGQPGQPFQHQYFPPRGTPYPPQGFYSYPPQQHRWNALCIIGFILAFQAPLAGLILSIIALVQINRTNEQSKGMSIAGIIIGAINTFLVFLFIVILIVAVGSAALYNNTVTDCGYGSEVCYDPDYYEYEDWGMQAAGDPLASIPLLSDTQK